MSRVVTTVAVTLPATATSPARVIPKGSVIEATAAEAAAITSAAGTTRAVTAASGQAAGTRDQLGESFGASNATP